MNGNLIIVEPIYKDCVLAICHKYLLPRQDMKLLDMAEYIQDLKNFVCCNKEIYEKFEKKFKLLTKAKEIWDKKLSRVHPQDRFLLDRVSVIWRALDTCIDESSFRSEDNIKGILSVYPNSVNTMRTRFVRVGFVHVKTRESPLYVACCYSACSVDIVASLLKAGADKHAMVGPVAKLTSLMAQVKIALANNEDRYLDIKCLFFGDHKKGTGCLLY